MGVLGPAPGLRGAADNLKYALPELPNLVVLC